MIELYDGLHTCEDVRSLGSRGVGEGPRMDYKEALSLKEGGTLTSRAKKDLARDVSALANAEGGLLVIGVKDPAAEGDAPAPEDFVGVAVTDTFARDLESVLLDAMSPPFYPQVKATEDDFEDPGSRERRRFVLVGVRRSPRLLQVTAGGDLRFYRRAGYQNRPMDAGEVRLRIAAETTAEAEADELLRAEAERIGRVFDGGPRVAFVAVPTLPHRFAVEPASWEARNRFQQFAGRQPPRYAPSGVEVLSPGFDGSQAFVPAGDGARSFYRKTNPDVTAEVRVRRDGLVSSARDGVELYSQPDEYLWLRKPQPWHEIFVPVPEEEFGPDMMEEALRRAGDGQPPLVRFSQVVAFLQLGGSLRGTRMAAEPLLEAYRVAPNVADEALESPICEELERGVVIVMPRAERLLAALAVVLELQAVVFRDLRRADRLLDASVPLVGHPSPPYSVETATP